LHLLFSLKSLNEVAEMNRSTWALLKQSFHANFLYSRSFKNNLEKEEMSDPDIKEETVPTVIGETEAEPVSPTEANPVEDQATLEATETPENATNVANEDKPEGEKEEVEEDPKAYLKEQAKRRNKGDGHTLADDFYYDYESLIFKPVVSDEGKQAPDLLKIL